MGRTWPALVLGIVISLSSCAMADNKCAGSGCEDQIDSLSGILESSEEPAVALRTLQGLEAQCQGNSKFHELLSYHLYNQEDFERAQKEARIAIEFAPRSGTAHHLLALSYFALGDRTEGLSSMETAYSVGGGDSRIGMNYCSILEAEGLYRRAIDVCGSVLHDKRYAGVAHIIRGRAFRALGDSDNAEKEIEAARALGHQP